MEYGQHDRRAFLSTLVRTGAGAAALVLTLAVPGRALSLGRAAAPSELINLGGIGIRHRGGYVLSFMLPQRDVQFRAICDVRADCRQAVKAMVDGRYGTKDCDMYRDFRDLLARDDIDAVLIATGDHWHALASILSARAGKDVYSEKPCAMTIGQARSLDDTMQRYGTVFQASTQRRNVEDFIFACVIALPYGGRRDGGLGHGCRLGLRFSCLDRREEQLFEGDEGENGHLLLDIFKLFSKIHICAKRNSL